MLKLSAAVARTLSACALIAIVWSAAAEQPYPNKQMRIIVAYAPGSSLDVLGRLLAQKLSGAVGQAVIVDNRPGGNTVIGTEALVRSAPDGHTLLLVVNTHAILPNLIPKLPYDPIRDFAPVATITSTEVIAALHPSVPANTLKELIALAKARPGQLNYASAGGGSTTHLATELLSMMAGITMQHIPYKGAGPALADLIAGQVQLSLNASIVTIPHVKSGKLKAIAISGEKRLAALPQVPTFIEAGLSGFDGRAWYGVLAPAGTPKEILDRLSAEMARIVAMPDFRGSLASQGMEPFVSTPEQFGAFLKEVIVRYARIIKTANIKLEN